VPSAAPLMERGQLRALGVSSAQRLPGFDNIPAISETLPGFDFIGWFALVAPAGAPSDAMERMNREMDAALKDPEIAKRMRDVGMYTEGAGTRDGTAAFVRAQLDAWRKIIQQIGLQPE
jgi:tripartite-type tricarboxylate transporter receptor subunit TctC